MPAVAFKTKQSETWRYESKTRRAIGAHCLARPRPRWPTDTSLVARRFPSAMFPSADAPAASAYFLPPMNLNQHGAACRCLLRLRENEGNPGMSDASFVARFLPRYPEWQELPGLTDATRITEIAQELELASSTETVRDYDRVLEQHRAGLSVLVQTERAPEQILPVWPMRRYVMLLVEMSESHFTVWCPYPSGLSDTLPRASRVWWEHWQSSGIILYPAAAVAPV